MIVLTNPKTLTAVLAVAPATTQPTFVVAYVDVTGSTIAEDSVEVTANGTTPVTLLNAPTAGTRRIVKSLYFTNNDTLASTVTASQNGVVALKGAAFSGSTIDLLTVPGTASQPVTSNFTVDRYVTGTNFTPGVTTSLTLSQQPPSRNACYVTFDGISQHKSQFSLAGTTVTFTQAIPLGVLEVEITCFAALLLGTVSDGTITLPKMAGLAANSLIGNNTGATATPLALTVTQVATLLGISGLATQGITGTLTFTKTGTTARQVTVQDRPGIMALMGEGLFTNFLHNGDVQVDQRNTLGTPITAPASTLTYGPDGWCAVRINATNVVTIGKVAVVNTPATGTLYACKLNVTTGATQAAGEYIIMPRRLEGAAVRRANFGTAQAASVYVSFWAESTLTGTFSFALQNGASNRSYVVNCAIASANTRQLFQFTVPGDTTGTWPTDNTLGMSAIFCPACGSAFQTTAGAWQAGNFLGTSSTTLLNNTTGSLQISDCYVGTTPIGTTSLDFPRLPFDVELQRCLRYLPAFLANGASTGQLPNNGKWTAANFATVILAFKVSTRAAPTGVLVSSASHFQTQDFSSAAAATSITFSSAGTDAAALVLQTASAFTIGQPANLAMSSTSAYLLLTGAEL